jgi:predicted PurR-regulated permease PerM
MANPTDPEDQDSINNKIKSEDNFSHVQATEKRVFVGLLILVSLLFLYLLKPFFNAIFWAGVIGIMFSPLQMRLTKKWQSQNLAALTTLAVCLLLGIFPSLLILSSLFRESVDLFHRIQSGEIDPSLFIDHIREGFPIVQELFESLNIDLGMVKERLSSAAIAASQFLAQNTIAIGQNTVQFFVSLGITIYLTFFILRDGPWLVALIIKALPLGDQREHQLKDKLVEVTRATVKGSLVVAIVQGSLGGIIFGILGIPGSVLWGVVMTLLSLIPVVGAGLVWGPVAVYLFAVGQWEQGLILTLFGAGVIGLVDNILRPILVGRDTKLPDYIVLLSTLGGFALFGMSGFVLGPVVAAVFVASWDIFMLESEELKQ